MESLRSTQALLMMAAVAICPRTARSQDDVRSNVVIQWNNAALQGVRDSKVGPPMVARALAIVHTWIYDAWAAYVNHAIFYGSAGAVLDGTPGTPGTSATPSNRN